MRKIAATYIFTPQNQIVKNGILICEDNGTIIDLIVGKETIKEQAELEYYSGILVPGFVNTHCHLELSNLKGKIEEGSGIGNFLKQINQLRNNRPENSESLYHNIDRKIWANGIAAIGDISNTTDTIRVKKKSKIYYHTFIESFGFHPSRAERAFKLAYDLKHLFDANELANSIVPHSAYSVSEPLLQKIAVNAREHNSLISIHNQESEAEILFLKSGNGAIAEHFQHNLNIDISHWNPSGKSSLNSILSFIPSENQLLLIHNTFTQKSDIDELKMHRKNENTFLVLCPNSNLYIENQLPPVSLFQDEELNICIGTDSLASNHELSILSELITLQNYFPEITMEVLFTWACINGAKALRIDNEFGSFEPNKNPGINLVTGIDFRTMKFTSTTKLKRLC